MALLILWELTWRTFIWLYAVDERWPMRRLIDVAFIVFAILGLSPNVHAVPTFTWEGPWTVTLLSNCLIERPGCQPVFGVRAFGASAMRDGQILDTSADIAVAKSERGSAFLSDAGSTGVNFSRQFLISGAPQGWTVSINGELNGLLDAFPGSAGASVSAMASITPSIGINFSETIQGRTLPAPFSLVVNQSKGRAGVLSDGLYTVSGSLITGAGGGPSNAFSNFFFASTPAIPVAGFQVSVIATPVPEPSTILLLATGLAGALWAYRKRALHV
jgi:PEP-CTERM motif-containing protein